MDGNLFRCGSVPAEINHSSYTHHMEKGISLSQNVVFLCERFQNQHGKRICKENHINVVRSKYKGKDYTGPYKKSHIFATQVLSN